jgi:hypothetical protein
MVVGGKISRVKTLLLKEVGDSHHTVVSYDLRSSLASTDLFSFMPRISFMISTC